MMFIMARVPGIATVYICSNKYIDLLYNYSEGED